MKAVLLKAFGGSENFYIGDADKPALEENSLLVKIKATALNRADVLQRKGKYPPPPGASSIIGLEMAGVVEEVSPNVTEWKKGDRVMALLPGGGYAQYCVIPAGMAMKIPDNFSFEQAAAIPEVFMTAYQALVWLGELKDSDNVLVHAGASGVGTAAIQIAKNVVKGANVFVTCGSQEKIDFCCKLGASKGFNYKSGPWDEGLLAATEKKGSDLTLDFVGASYFQSNLNAAALEGRIILLGFLSGFQIKDVSIANILRRRLTVKGTTLRARSLDYKTKLTKDINNVLIPLFESGAIKPIVSKVFDWKNVKDAHDFMEANKNIGKIIMNGM